MNRRKGWRLGGQSRLVILDKITGGIEVSVVVLTDDDWSLRSHNVGEFSGGQQIVLLSLVKPQVGRISGQGPTVGVKRSRTIVAVEPNASINSLQVLIIGNRLRGCQSWLWWSGC